LDLLYRGSEVLGAARPESATAQIAFASTYENYADKARGSGYANTVSEDGWKLYAQRNALAASTLAEAAKLKEKCPYWYEAVQDLALAQGGNKSQAKKLLENAAAFEPTYYHYYREYARISFCQSGMESRVRQKHSQRTFPTRSAVNRASLCILKSPASLRASAIRMTRT
jgi:hypothetical protein